MRHAAGTHLELSKVPPQHVSDHGLAAFKQLLDLLPQLLSNCARV